MTDTRLGEWLKSCTFPYWCTGQHKISAEAFFQAWARGEAVLLDLRDEVEAQFLQLPFALHIPIHRLPDELHRIPRDRLVATFCSGGDRAAVAFAYLQALGFKNVRIFKGGYASLIQELLPGRLVRYQKKDREPQP